MVSYICIYDIINRKTYLKTLYLIPNTFKEWAENFKSLPQYCPVMPTCWDKGMPVYAKCLALLECAE